MGEIKQNRFLKYFPLLIDALRSTDPKAMRPAEAMAWIRAKVAVPADDLTRQILNGKQSIFENDVHWARFYLVKAGLVDKSKRGSWGLTPLGRTQQLTDEEIWATYTRIRDAHRLGAAKSEEDIPAPTDDEGENDGSNWFVGAVWDDVEPQDQTPRFLAEGVWENGWDEKFSDLVLRMKPGDRIAIKAGFVQKWNLPFDVGGKSVSVMRIKATGTIIANLNDGKKIKVAWDSAIPPRDWYFYTYRTTIVEADMESELAVRLVDFTFQHQPQDYAWFLAQEYWSEKYGAAKISIAGAPGEQPLIDQSELIEVELEPAYTVDDIVADGCFLLRDELANILDRWRSKMNLVLQGPPGTGKTWLAKRLGFALVGSSDRETTRSRLRVVQFHPSLAYEDFVRGWRPEGKGRLALVDGILMQAIKAAASEPDRPFVLVIEEINRGNPAQILGEMLTLLEDTKRSPSEGMELAYRKEPGERVHVPKNLYVIGTMNIADRSLAIVDLALRRRFAFVDLEPRLGIEWRNWCASRGLAKDMLLEIETRIHALNADIASAVSLGPQFRIGHSYVTPKVDEEILDSRAWFRAKVETEIGPLLDEYWYDSMETAKSAKGKLLAGLA